MRTARLTAVAVPAAAALAVLAAGAAVLWLDLEAAELPSAASLLTAPRIGLLMFFALALAAVVAGIAWRAYTRTVEPARRLAEGTRLVVHGNPAHRLQDARNFALGDLAAAIDALAADRARALAEIDAAAQAARAEVDGERARLAALVAELDQAVVVCNRDGRVLLYNQAAQTLLAGGEAADTAPLGLGRSVFGIIDRSLVLHAVESMERQLGRATGEGTHFVTASPDGRLLRVQAAPVEADGALGGYVLLVSDVTESVDAAARQVAVFQGLVEGTRGAAASIRAAIETLIEHPEMDAGRRARFTAIVRDEAVQLSARLHAVTAEVAERLKVRWPLEEMRGEDLLTLARSRIEGRVGLAVKYESVDPELWLRVDSFSLAQGLAYVARRLKDEFDVREVRFRLMPAAGHAQLDLIWRGAPLATETAFAWQNEPFTLGGEDSPLTLAQVIERHGGEAWHQRDLPAQSAYFRFMLPLAPARAAARPRPRVASRPAFYDFDLFRSSPASARLDDRALADLAYTVFDTETTGLDPAAGDEIIAVGAVRIVNGRVLSGETFESLVDPGRDLPEASVAVHGITAHMLAGQPTVDAVLPRLRRFAEETVLVGHNAAFDLRFLQLKEAQTGVRFDQPVLDTLLLSAVVHEAQQSHSLEEIAGRLGVAVVGRHTALGDALVTAEVFLRLLPLLAERGIRTLGEARAAAQKTYYAQLAY